MLVAAPRDSCVAFGGPYRHLGANTPSSSSFNASHRKLSGWMPCNPRSLHSPKSTRAIFHPLRQLRKFLPHPLQSPIPEATEFEVELRLSDAAAARNLPFVNCH